MSDNKLLKTIMNVATLTGLAAGIGWTARKVVKENFGGDPSSNVMNYVKFTAVMAGSVALKKNLEDQKTMANIPMILERAIPNAASFTGGNYLAK